MQEVRESIRALQIHKSYVPLVVIYVCNATNLPPTPCTHLIPRLATKWGDKSDEGFPHAGTITRLNVGGWE